MEFEYIHLSRSEMHALKRLKEDMVLDGELEDKAVYRLMHLEFISRHQFCNPDRENTVFYQIEDMGHDYLMYCSGMKRRRKIEVAAYWITTAIALVALVKSFL